MNRIRIDNEVPLSGIGTWVAARHYGPKEYAELSDTPSMLAGVVEAHLRFAHADAARNSLTVLSATEPEWVASAYSDGSMLLRVYLRVIHEPQADRRLLYDVTRALASNPDLWHPGGYSPHMLAEAAINAVRDHGRLTATNPPPPGIPE